MATSRDKAKRTAQYTKPSQRAETRGSGGGATMIARPEGMEFFSAKEAKVYKIDILPYLVKRGSDKQGGNPYAPTGALHYERTFWAHYGVGPGNKQVVCPSATWGKPCPICEDRAKLERQRSTDKEVKNLIYSMKPKERQLFYLYDRTSASEEAKGVKLWEFAFFNFGKLLDRRIKMAVDENKEQFESFHSLEDGSRLLVTISEQSMKDGGTYMGASIIDFVKRKTPLPETLLDDLTPLEDLLVEIPYKKLKNWHEGVEEEDDTDDDTPPARTEKKMPVSADGEDDDDAPPPRKKTPPVKPVEPDDDDDDTPKVPEKKTDKKPPTKPVDDDEDEPAPPKKKDNTKFAVDDRVIYDEEECVITKVSGDGTSFTLKDGDGTIHKAIESIEFRLAPPKKPGKKPTKPVEDDDDE